MKRDDDGSSVVEFAVILPVLILLILGLVEFGYRYAKASQLNDFAYIGARDVSISGAVSADTSGRITTAAGASATVAVPDGCAGVGADNAQVTIVAVLGSPTGLFGETFTLHAAGVARCNG